MRAPTIALAVAITAVTGCSRTSDNKAIERIVRVEKERGNIAGFQIIPLHLTVEAMIAPSTARATPETELAFARQWGRVFLRGGVEEGQLAENLEPHRLCVWAGDAKLFLSVP